MTHRYVSRDVPRFWLCQNGAIEDGTAIVTDLATTRVDEDSTNHNAVELFQDKLVEESGILGGEEIYLEDVRKNRKKAQAFSLNVMVLLIAFTRFSKS